MRRKVKTLLNDKQKHIILSKNILFSPKTLRKQCQVKELSLFKYSNPKKDEL